MSLNRAPFHRVLHRPILFMGGERELTMLAALIASGLIMIGQNVPAVIIGVLLWFVLIAAFRQMAKADPQMSLVYRRYIRFQKYYPARSRPFIGYEMSTSRQFALIGCGAFFFAFIVYVVA